MKDLNMKKERLLFLINYNMDDSMYKEDSEDEDLVKNISIEKRRFLFLDEVIKSSLFEGCALDHVDNESNKDLFFECINEVFKGDSLALSIANDYFEKWVDFWENERWY